MPHIQRALKDNVSLIQMGLSFNQIGDDGAQELASVLQINRVCTDICVNICMHNNFMCGYEQMYTCMYAHIFVCVIDKGMNRHLYE